MNKSDFFHQHGHLQIVFWYGVSGVVALAEQKKLFNESYVLKFDSFDPKNYLLCFDVISAIFLK